MSGSRNPLDCVLDPLGGLMVVEKSHRLMHGLYQGEVVVALTACLKDRTLFFVTEERFRIFEQMLLRAIKRFNVAAEVYLFMPDHVHLLLRGETATSDVLWGMRMFKQYSGFWFSQNASSFRWQKDFYDHIVRNDESVEKHTQYILNNPVRKGLVEYWGDYPYKGSTMHDLNSWD